MKIAIVYKDKTTGVVASYQIIDGPPDVIKGKVKRYNESQTDKEAVIIDDELMVNILNLHESTETVKGCVSDVMEEIDALRSEADNRLDAIRSAFYGIVCKVDASLEANRKGGE